GHGQPPNCARLASSISTMATFPDGVPRLTDAVSRSHTQSSSFTTESGRARKRPTTSTTMAAPASLTRIRLLLPHDYLHSAIEWFVDAPIGLHREVGVAMRFDREVRCVYTLPAKNCLHRSRSLQAELLVGHRTDSRVGVADQTDRCRAPFLDRFQDGRDLGLG